MDNELIEAVSFLKASKHRREIMNALGNNIATPSEISLKTDIRLNHVSTMLKELKLKRLVVCLNENNKRGRLYQLTEMGKLAINVIRQST